MRLPGRRHWFLGYQFPRALHRQPDGCPRHGADRATAGSPSLLPIRSPPRRVLASND